MSTIQSIKRRDIQKLTKLEYSGWDTCNDVNVYSAFCPNCRMELIRIDENDVKNLKYGERCAGDNNFCSRCGQRLAWPGDKRWNL